MNANIAQPTTQAHPSVLFRQFSLPFFDTPYHYHASFELTYIVKSTGKRYVGNHVADFQAGDLVLLAPNLAHCWKNNATTDNQAQSIVVQFQENFVGKDFFDLPETKHVRQLLAKAQAGIWVQGKTRDRIARELHFLLNASPLHKILGLIDLLNTIALSNEYTLLDVQNPLPKLDTSDLQRINKVYAYIIENYTQDVQLETAAQLANMTETAFCRYFKKITNKTFLDVVTDFKIKHACHLLSKTDKQVAEVCFESGFGNVSHFNKQFKAIIDQSPLGYRKAQQSMTTKITTA